MRKTENCHYFKKMTIHVESPKDVTDFRNNESSKVSKQKLISFLYTSRKVLKFNSQKLVKIRCLVINLTKEIYYLNANI